MDPFTISLIISAGLTALQMGSSIANSQAEANKRNEIASFNGLLADVAGADAKARGENAAALTRAQASMDIADMQAAYGASGVDGTVGSPLDAMRAYRRKSDLDILTLRNNAAREAWGYRLQAMQASEEGRMASLRAQNEQVGTLLGGAGQMASLFGRAYSNEKLNSR